MAILDTRRNRKPNSSPQELNIFVIVFHYGFGILKFKKKNLLHKEVETEFIHLPVFTFHRALFWHISHSTQGPRKHYLTAQLSLACRVKSELLSMPTRRQKTLGAWRLLTCTTSSLTINPPCSCHSALLALNMGSPCVKHTSSTLWWGDNSPRATGLPSGVTSSKKSSFPPYLQAATCSSSGLPQCLCSPL